QVLDRPYPDQPAEPVDLSNRIAGSGGDQSDDRLDYWSDASDGKKNIKDGGYDIKDKADHFADDARDLAHDGHQYLDDESDHGAKPTQRPRPFLTALFLLFAFL